MTAPAAHGVAFEKRLVRLIPLLLLAAGTAAYHGSLGNAFVFDDLPYIVENGQIRSLWPASGLLARTTRPVINLSFAVNHALGGLDPWGYRLVNVGVHLLAALVLYGVVRRSIEAIRPRPRWSERGPWAAGFVALLWAVHPLQTQSVTYVWQRCESLMGLFYLLTLYCVIRSDRSAHASAWKSAAVVSCALGMATKEVMVTAPLAVLLYDRIFLAGSWREIGRRRLGLHAGLAATWLVLAFVLARGAEHAGIWKASWLIGYREVSPWSYLLIQAGVILHYLRLAAWPDRLCLDYGPTWPVPRTSFEAAPDLIAVGVLLLATAWAWRRHPALGFVGIWFFLILAPTSSFVPLEDRAFEHRMYLPLAAVIVLVVTMSLTLLEHLPAKWGWGRWAFGAMAVLLVIACSVGTARRNQDYRSPLTIWRDTVTKAPWNARAHLNLGLALKREGRIEEAIAQYRETVRIDPRQAPAHNNWGIALEVRGRVDEAIAHYQEALRLEPDFAAAHVNMGNALLRQRRVDEAIDHYRLAVQFDPSLVPAHVGWGNALYGLGRFDEAVAHYREVVRIEPRYAQAHFNLGLALKALGRRREAHAHVREALRLNPDLAPEQATDRPLRVEKATNAGESPTAPAREEP